MDFNHPGNGREDAGWWLVGRHETVISQGVDRRRFGTRIRPADQKKFGGSRRKDRLLGYLNGKET